MEDMPERADSVREESQLASVISRNQSLLEELDHAVDVLGKRVRPVSKQINERTEPGLRDHETKAVQDTSSVMVQMISSQNDRLRSILNKVRGTTELLEV